MLLDTLELWFGSVPADLDAAIRANTDLARFKQWLATALSAATLADFRQSTQLCPRSRQTHSNRPRPWCEDGGA